MFCTLYLLGYISIVTVLKIYNSHSIHYINFSTISEYWNALLIMNKKNNGNCNALFF